MIILNTKVFYNRQQLLSSNFINTRSCSWKTSWWRHKLVCGIQLSWGFRSCPESFYVQSFNIILIMSMVSAYRKRWFIQHQNRPNNAFDCSGPGDSGYELPGYRMNLLTHAVTYTSPLLCLTSKRQDVLYCSVYCNIRLLFYVAVTANINHITYQYCFLSAALPAS